MREATLQEVLMAREDRMREQNELLSKFGKPLVSFTMNIAGPVKNTELIRAAFFEGKRMLDEALKEHRVVVLAESKKDDVTGCELLYAVSYDGPEEGRSFDDGEEADYIKRVCVSIEEASELGRLFDLDVIKTGGTKIERAEERKCLICGRPGKGCASRRVHSVAELQSKTKKIISDHFALREAARISQMVTSALEEEVLTTPKPGLVDRNNNGSHRDMDIDTFMASAKALEDYWGKCFLIGYETSGCAGEDTFLELRKEGLKAEEKMYGATGGVNTHMGAIFLLGTVCGAIGRLWDPGCKEENSPDEFASRRRIAEECRQMTYRIMEDEIKGSSCAHRGARGEIADGLPGVIDVGLPVFTELLAKGADRNAAGAGAFVALAARGTDTNMIRRGGVRLAEEAAGWATQMVSDDKLLDRESIEELDKRFIELDLSPGGCADLLAITYFLYDHCRFQCRF